MEMVIVRTRCVWCHKETVQSFPAQVTDTALVRRGDDEERVICHSCVKHLAVIVLEQEFRLERVKRG